MGIYRVDEMESLIRIALNEPSQERITSGDILQAINDGYKEVGTKMFCIEQEDTVYTVAGCRFVPFTGCRVNFVELVR